jgi:hypothetical protein
MQRSGISITAGALRIIIVEMTSGNEYVVDVDQYVVPTASPSAFLVQTSDAAY